MDTHDDAQKQDERQFVSKNKHVIMRVHTVATAAALLAATTNVAGAAMAPNILFIVADDLGLNDVPFTGTGCEIKTPTLTKLSSEGTVLRDYYVNAICTPTRTSFMTAK